MRKEVPISASRDFLREKVAPAKQKRQDLLGERVAKSRLLALDESIHGERAFVCALKTVLTAATKLSDCSVDKIRRA